ncbi:MAG: AraC family transcriptional regulator ligand-binding domain-containing protein [Nevskia sp.]|nr:AraC family transcriptional regulator ligand-binding domain-containing protein [Nevskia sp.]
MSKPDVRVPARYYARLADVLARDRVDLDGVLRSLRLPARLLTQPNATIPFSKVDQLVCRAAALSGRSDLAFELGKLLTASAHSFVGFGMINSANLDQALHFEARYFGLLMPSFRMRYSSGPDHAEIQFTPLVAMSRLCLAFHLEAIGTAAWREIADLTGERQPPCRLELSIPEPLHLQRYRELRNVEVRFGVDMLPGVRLRLLDDPRGYRLAMADAHARLLAEERCRALVRQVVGVRGFGDWVAMTLREVSEGLPTLEELAATLNISKRTLNRYLEREGTSFRELSCRIQHELACERLARGDMSVTQVAYSLGFTDTSNFGRAFRARAGYSPGEHRRKASAGRVGRVGSKRGSEL